MGEMVSKEVWLEAESRLFVEVREVVRERVLLRDFLGFIWTALGDSFGRAVRAGLAFGVLS